MLLQMLSITKLQNLKAIHNNRFCASLSQVDVINHKTTKFESNSQHWLQACSLKLSCYQSQNYKIWKQFTTNDVFLTELLLLSITKLQNLKAIHNTRTIHYLVVHVVINYKTTKFESNSQHDTSPHHTSKRCYQSQNYKIWKQFTTSPMWTSYQLLMLSITKLQN